MIQYKLLHRSYVSMYVLALEGFKILPVYVPSAVWLWHVMVNQMLRGQKIFQIIMFTCPARQRARRQDVHADTQNVSRYYF
jgi:hypothetical protein